MALSIAEGLVAALGGGAKKAGEILDEKRKLELEKKKAEFLNQLREDSDKRLAVHRNELEQGNVSSEFSGVEADEFIYRDKKGEEVRRRALTDAEKAARQAAKDTVEWERNFNERELKQRWDIANMQAQTSRMNAAARASGRGDGSDGIPDSGDAYGILKKVVYDNVGKSLDEVVAAGDGTLSRAALDQVLDNMITAAAESAMETGKMDSRTLIRNAREYIITVSRIPEDKRSSIPAEAFPARRGGPRGSLGAGY